MELLRHKKFEDILSTDEYASDKVCEFVNSNPYIQIMAINTNYKDSREIVDLYYKLDDEAPE